MNLNALKFCLGILSLLVCSCSPNVYTTIGQNVPMFKARGEASVNVNLIYSEKAKEIVGVQAQGAYAISDKFAASFSINSLKQLKNRHTFWSGQGFYYEIAGGAYGTSGNNLFTFEVFGGLGSGYLRNQNPERPTEVLTTNVFKPFIQPSIGVSGYYAEVAFTPRVAYMNYTVSGYNSIKDGEVIAPINDRGSFVFEPGITLRTGFVGTKFQIQYNYSTFNPSPHTNGIMNRSTISFGLFLLLSQRGDYYGTPF